MSPRKSTTRRATKSATSAKRATKRARSPQPAARSRLPASLAQKLTPLIKAELAAIAAIDGAVSRSDRPDYTTLYHEAKNDHQANVTQLTTLARLAGADVEEKGGLMARFAELQTKLVEELGTVVTLRAMRLATGQLRDGYRQLADELDGLPRRALTMIADRLDRHWHVLTAHVARHASDPSEEAARLPRPLGDYFATDKAHACERCLLDRPGLGRVLHRADPYTYVCAACHDEVAASFPADLRTQMHAWPEALREARVIEKAIGHPSKETAKKQVLTVLSGQPPLPLRRPTKAAPATIAATALATGPTPPTPRQRAATNAAVEEFDRTGATESELAYTDLLFDYRSVRETW